MRGFIIIAAGQDLKLPDRKDSLHFAVLGDTGTGGKEQYQVARQVTAFHAVFPFDFVIMF